MELLQEMIRKVVQRFITLHTSMMHNTFTKTIAAVASSAIIASATLVFAQSPLPTPPPVRAAKSAVDLVCLQNVVERRDNSIIAAADGYHATVKAALEARRDGLKAAFGITDKYQRQAAVRNSWNTFKATQRKAKTALRDARNAAWQKFSTDRKTCGSGAAAEDKTPSGVDAEL